MAENSALRGVNTLRWSRRSKGAEHTTSFVSKVRSAGCESSAKSLRVLGSVSHWTDAPHPMTDEHIVIFFTKLPKDCAMYLYASLTINTHWDDTAGQHKYLTISLLVRQEANETPH